MQITQHTDFALRVLLYTACNPNQLVTINTISTIYGISKSHLMKVVPVLVKGQFLTSIRGNRGGLKLAKPPEEINIGEVFRHTESLQLVECMRKDNQCHITPACRLANVFYGAQMSFLHYLDSFTLADLINEPLYDLLAEKA